MTDTQAPERIWLTGEYSIWSTFRSFNASDLDHSNDDGTSDYQEYVRADRVPAPAVPDDVAGVIADCRHAVDALEGVGAFLTCQGILRQAADALEAQAAEVARLRTALEGLLHHEIGHVGPYAGQRVTEARAALTQPTGEPK